MSPHIDFKTSLCQCGCVYYLKKVSEMPEMSVWGRPRELNHPYMAFPNLGPPLSTTKRLLSCTLRIQLPRHRRSPLQLTKEFGWSSNTDQHDTSIFQDPPTSALKIFLSITFVVYIDDLSLITEPPAPSLEDLGSSRKTRSFSATPWPSVRAL